MAAVTWSPKKEEREITFLYQFIGGYLDGLQRQKGSSMPSIEDMANRLTSFITKLFNDGYNELAISRKLSNIGIFPQRGCFENPGDLKTLMLDTFHTNCLSTERFDWISPDNDRLCNFIWAFLKSSRNVRGTLQCEQSFMILDGEDGEVNSSRAPKINILNTMPDTDTNAYREIGLPMHMSGSHEKKKCIIRFFDLWDVSIINKECQMKGFEEAWQRIKNNSKMEAWLNKNEKLAKWAWDYTFKKYLNSHYPVWVDLSEGNEAERDTMITLYDLLSVEHRTILMASLSKSGAQQKYRTNSDDRKGMNIPLSEEHKEMLRKIAKDSNRRIYQIAEDIIAKEYQRLYPN